MIVKPGENKLSRRKVLASTLQAVPLLVTPALLAAAEREQGCRPTPPQSEGPFYPTAAIEAENNLIRPGGGRGVAGGVPIVVMGRVTGAGCRPLAHARVEIWQADHQGRYHHPNEPSRKPLHPFFRYWGSTASDSGGWYRFVTIAPAPYAAGGNWTRPPHIHFKAGSGGRLGLTTQMYFPGMALNERDYLLNGVAASLRPLLVARRLADPPAGAPPHTHFRFDIALA